MFYNHLAIKQNGKLHSQQHKATIVIGLIYALLGAGVNLNFSSSTSQEELQQQLQGMSSQEAMAYAIGIITTSLVVSGLVMFYKIFVGNIIQNGCMGYLTKSVHDENPTVGEAFSGFKNYSTVLSTTLLRDLYIFLWSLLFVIPGIVKSYSYSMVDFIKAENPSLPANKAIEMSKIMTDGYKGNLFYLDLSFIGWNLLSVLTFGILSILFVNPYYLCSKAYAYEQLKAIAISSGKLSQYDFNDFSDYSNGINDSKNNDAGGNPYSGMF